MEPTVTTTVTIELNHAVPMVLLRHYIAEAIERWQEHLPPVEKGEDQDPLVDAIASVKVVSLAQMLVF